MADPLAKYDFFKDKNLIEYFHRRSVQQNLLRAGLINREGVILNWDDHKSKLKVIDNAFDRAKQCSINRLRKIREIESAVARNEAIKVDFRAKKENVLKRRKERQIQSELTKLLH